MPEVRSIDHPDDLAIASDDLLPRPRALNRPDWRAAAGEKEAVRQSPPPRAMRPISCDCNERCRPARPRPLPGRPNLGSNLFSSSAIRQDMRHPDNRLKYLAGERRKSAVPCVGNTTQFLRRAGTGDRQSPEKKMCSQTHSGISATSGNPLFLALTASLLPPSSKPPPTIIAMTICTLSHAAKRKRKRRPSAAPAINFSCLSRLNERDFRLL